MEYKSSIDIFRRYFEQQLEKARKALEKSEYHNQPFITISRQTGAGGVGFPAHLVRHLNEIDYKESNQWMYFDKDILEIVLEQHNLPKEIKKFMPERKVSEFQDVIEQLFKLHPNEHRLIKKVSDTILHLSHLGNVVLVGRGSNIITSHSKNGLHLRLIDKLDNRIANIMDFFKLNKVQALKLIQAEDKNRETYIRKYFSKNINDASLYSLVINFGIMKVDDVIELVIHEVHKLKKHIG